MNESAEAIPGENLIVLRLGHRIERDKRMTTHVALTARALGADGIIIAARDSAVEEQIMDVINRWGGSFFVRSGAKWQDEIRKWKSLGGKVCHLTMYGVNLQDAIEEIRKQEKVMVVVGAEKVPGRLYGLADWNVAVGHQPHSEVAALAVFLDRYFEGKELKKEFEGGEMKITGGKFKKRVKLSSPRTTPAAHPEPSSR